MANSTTKCTTVEGSIENVLWLYQPRDLLSRQSIALRRAEPGQVLSDPERFDKLDNAPRAWRSFRTIRRR
jgi:hypothetical protein